MAIPSYAYLKLKISGLVDIITVGAKAQRALDYEQSNIELATAAITTVELELCLSAPPSSTSPIMPSTLDTFKVTKDANAVQIDAGDPTKTVQIRANLSPK
jgi:hypothetical protein